MFSLYRLRWIHIILCTHTDIPAYYTNIPTNLRYMTEDDEYKNVCDDTFSPYSKIVTPCSMQHAACTMQCLQQENFSTHLVVIENKCDFTCFQYYLQLALEKHADSDSQGKELFYHWMHRSEAL